MFYARGSSYPYRNRLTFYIILRLDNIFGPTLSALDGKCRLILFMSDIARGARYWVALFSFACRKTVLGVTF